MCLQVIALSIIFLAAGATMSRAQNDAESLAKRLQAQLLANPAIQMKFTLENEGVGKIKADLKHKRIRIESPSMLVISDGTTIWNLNKQSQHVTVDGVSQSSPFRDPASLFKFSENYTAKSIVSQGYVLQYELTLRPKDKLKSLLKAAGDITELVVDLHRIGEKLEIHNARATSARGEEQATELDITPIKKIRTSDFAFKVTGKMKVLDLRE